MKQKDFNLLLGGGAALGYAHVGVMEWLDEHEMHPASIHGVSMGAIIGAVAALDMPFKEKLHLFESVFSSLKWIRPKLDGSLIDTRKIHDILTDIFGSTTIAKLPTPLFVHATDYHTGEGCVFSHDNDAPIVDALLASMAVPALFPPKEIGGRLYVDGYIHLNLPLGSVTNNLPNIIVNVTGRNAFKELPTKHLKELSILQNLERSIRILIHNQTDTALRHFSKEFVLIEPNVADFKTSSFKSYHEIRQRGYEAAHNTLTHYKEHL